MVELEIVCGHTDKFNHLKSSNVESSRRAFTQSSCSYLGIPGPSQNQNSRLESNNGPRPNKPNLICALANQHPLWQGI